MELPEELEGDETFALELGDTIDLHTFAPRDVPAVVRAFLDHACDKGYAHVRIIHGKGIGVQREIVRKILDRDPRVRRYGDPPDGAGWGATEVDLAP